MIRRIIRWHYDGQSDDAIAKKLNAEKVSARDLSGWSAGAVRKVIAAAPTSRWGPLDEED